MRIQNDSTLKKHNNNHDISKKISVNESLNHQLSDEKIKKIDFEDDSILVNDDDDVEGLIVASVGHGGSVKDRQSVYFRPPHEDILEYSENDLDDSTSADISNDNSNNASNDVSNHTFVDDGRVRYKKLVKYPSEMGSNHDDVILDRYADAENIGSAPVGNGKWSILKRKKVDIDAYRSKDFTSDELDTVSKNLPLDNLLSHNFNTNEQTNDSFKFDSIVSNSSSLPIMSPRTSLLTMAFSAESSVAQATKTDPCSHVSADNSSLAHSNDEIISLSESSETNSKSPLSKTFEANLPQTNLNSFIPKFSSPLAIRAPIIASTDDYDVNQNIKHDDNVEEFTNIDPAQNIRDEQEVNNKIQPTYNQPTSPETTDSLLPPIKEEFSNSHNNSLRSIVKKTGPDSSTHVKSTHLREASNSLQMLFVNTDIGNDENIPDETKISDQKNDNYSQDDVKKKNFILSDKFRLAVKKGWNNEFVEAEEILMRRKDGIPRWYVAFAEVQLVKHLMTGQAMEYQNPELINSLMEAEKLASKVCDNKDDFETTFTMFITDVWKTDIKPVSTPSEDEAEFASLRANYRWDCELAMADILIFRSVLQVIGGSEIKGALNLRRAWKLYSKVKDEIDRIKGDSNKNAHKNEPSSANSNNSNRWSLIGISSMVRFGSHTPESSDDVVNSIKIDPDIEDYLEFGIGIFNFIISIVPGSFLSMLKTFGFSVDRAPAIRMLENCYSRDGVRAPFAAFFLLLNYLFLPRGIADATPSLTRAGIIAKECVNKYPKSSPFLFMACQQSRKTGNLNDAINYITTGVRSCDNVGVTSTHYRFEMGMTYLMNLDISTAKDIFELLFYGNTIIYTGTKGSIRLQGSMKDSSRFASRDGSTKKDKPSLQLFEFELRPFCGLCLAGCYFMLKSGESITNEVLEVLKQTQTMTCPPVENNSSSIAGSIGLLGSSASGLVGFGNGISGDKKEPKANRYNKFAGRYATNINKNLGSPFLLHIILYLRRDIFYMSLELKKQWANLLETIWTKVPKPIDPDVNSVYLLIRGVFEKSLNDDPTVAQTTLCECLALEIGIVNETWVIPHCRYELGELFYKKLGDQEAAMEQFKWILKGPRPTSRGITSRRDSNLSIISLASKSSSESGSVPNNPDKFKKYEFVKVLKQRCTIAVEQIRSGTLSPTNVLTQHSPQHSSLSPMRHNRKKSGSNSSLLKEIKEQTLQRQLIHTSEDRDVTSAENFDNNAQGSMDENITKDGGFIFNTKKFRKKTKEKSTELPQHEVESIQNNSDRSGSRKGLKGKLALFKFR
ncbi:tetratricopeptide repeat domain 39b [Gigaspora margarita]|uniref:Tetratricopeptide repeat domain 39b n=1 Tax=Gigaspora margarita TaxID=4874 RepID=A0A8H4AEG9_GIGMA|nr:tetratricopeptide repeat domain 39b [Gigaspora margarita]